MIKTSAYSNLYHTTIYSNSKCLLNLIKKLEDLYDNTLKPF